MIYRFGTFQLDSVRETLVDVNGPVALRDHALRVLKLLIERAPEVVSKDEILNAVWGHEALSESSIAQVIKDIRAVLGDSAKSPEMVVTRYGRGYQFVGQVDASENQGSFVAAPVRQGPRHTKPFLLVTMAALILAVVMWQWLKPQAPVVEAPTQWLIRPVDAATGESLSKPFAEYLSFVVRTMAGDDRIGIASTDEVIPGARYLDVTLGVSEGNSEQRFQLTLAEAAAADKPLPTFYSGSAPLMSESVERIFQSIKFSPESNIESGVVSQSAFATETLLRGMAAQFDGDTNRAIALFEACLAEDENFDFARYELSIALRRKGDYERALALLKTLEARHQSDFWLVRLNNAMGISHWRLGQYEDADLRLDAAYRHAGTAELRANISTNLAILRRDQSQFESAEAAALDAVRNSDADKYPRTAASALNTWASILMRTGRLREAIAPLKRAQDLFQADGNRAGYASVLSRNGDLHEQLGDYAQAEQLFRLSAGIREQLNDAMGLATSQFDLARIARINGQFDDSRKLAQSGLDAVVSKGDTHLMIKGHLNLAKLDAAERRFDDAKVHAAEAVRLAEQRAEPEPLLQARHDMLAIELDSISIDDLAALQRLDQPIDALLSDTKSGNNTSLAAQTLLLRGRLYAKQQELAKARAEFSAAVEQGKSQDDRILQSTALIELAQLELADDPTLSASALARAAKLDPPSYPYSVVLAKVLAAQGKTQEALAVAHEVKQTSGNWWNEYDEAFLSRLIEAAKQR